MNYLNTMIIMLIAWMHSSIMNNGQNKLDWGHKADILQRHLLVYNARFCENVLREI